MFAGVPADLVASVAPVLPLGTPVSTGPTDANGAARAAAVTDSSLAGVAVLAQRPSAFLVSISVPRAHNLGPQRPRRCTLGRGRCTQIARELPSCRSRREAPFVLTSVG